MLHSLTFPWRCSLSSPSSRCSLLFLYSLRSSLFLSSLRSLFLSSLRSSCQHLTSLIAERPLSEGLLPPASGQNSFRLETGRSGGAGYTDPNNNYYRPNETRTWNDFVRAPESLLVESLVGIRDCHRTSLVRQDTAKRKNYARGARYYCCLYATGANHCR